MYVRDLSDQRLTFGVSGRLWKDALVMYDHQTNSLWGHVIGKAIAGTLEGRSLETYPATQTTWKAWKRAHPDTKVLKKPRLRRSSYAGYDANPARIGIHGRRIKKSQLPPKSKIAGFELDGQMFAFPLSSLKPGQTLVPLVDEVPLLIYVDEAGQGVSLWRVRDRKTLASYSLDTEMPTRVVGRDGSVYSLLSQSRSLAGGDLVRMQVVIAYWFGWHNFHPLTEVLKP